MRPSPVGKELALSVIGLEVDPSSWNSMKVFVFAFVWRVPPAEKKEVVTVASHRPPNEAKRGPPPSLCAGAPEASRSTAGRSIGTIDFPMRFTSREPRGGRKERRRVLQVPRRVKSTRAGADRGPEDEAGGRGGRSLRGRPESAE